jgi:hypothetical protein
MMTTKFFAGSPSERHNALDAQHAAKLDWAVHVILHDPKKMAETLSDEFILLSHPVTDGSKMGTPSSGETSFASPKKFIGKGTSSDIA